VAGSTAVLSVVEGDEYYLWWGSELFHMCSVTPT
jgi:hypothetical protein